MALQRYNKKLENTDALNIIYSASATPAIKKDPTDFLLDNTSVSKINKVDVSNFIKFVRTFDNNYKLYDNKDSSNNTIVIGTVLNSSTLYISLGNQILTLSVNNVLVENDSTNTVTKCKLTISKTNPIIENNTVKINTSVLTASCVEYDTFIDNNNNINEKINDLSTRIETILSKPVVSQTVGNGSAVGTDTASFVSVKVTTTNGIASSVLVQTQNIASTSSLNLLSNRVGILESASNEDLTHLYSISDSKNNVSLYLRQGNTGGISNFDINVKYATLTESKSITSGIVESELLITYVPTLIGQITNDINDKINSLTTNVNELSVRVNTNITDIRNINTSIGNISSNISDLSTYVHNTLSQEVSALSINLSDLSTYTNNTLKPKVNSLDTNLTDLSTRFNQYKTETNTSISDISTRLSNIPIYSKAETNKLGLVLLGYTKSIGTDIINLPVNIDSNGNLYISIAKQDIKDLGFDDDSFTPVYLTTT